MFLERKTKARPGRKNFHLKFSKTPSDNYIRLTDKKAQHVWFRKKKKNLDGYNYLVLDQLDFPVGFPKRKVFLF